MRDDIFQCCSCEVAELLRCEFHRDRNDLGCGAGHVIHIWSCDRRPHAVPRGRSPSAIGSVYSNPTLEPIAQLRKCWCRCFCPDSTLLGLFPCPRPGIEMDPGMLALLIELSSAQTTTRVSANQALVLRCSSYPACTTANCPLHDIPIVHHQYVPCVSSRTRFMVLTSWISSLERGALRASRV